MRFVVRVLFAAAIGFQLYGCAFSPTPIGLTNAQAGAGGSGIRAPSVPFPGVGFIAAPPSAGTPFGTP
jgi:hypothetical protein